MYSLQEVEPVSAVPLFWQTRQGRLSVILPLLYVLAVHWMQVEPVPVPPYSALQSAGTGSTASARAQLATAAVPAATAKLKAVDGTRPMFEQLLLLRPWHAERQCHDGFIVLVGANDGAPWLQANRLHACMECLVSSTRGSVQQPEQERRRPAKYMTS